LLSQILKLLFCVFEIEHDVFLKLCCNAAIVPEILQKYFLVLDLKR